MELKLYRNNTAIKIFFIVYLLMIKNKIIEVKKNRKLKVKDYAGMVFSINPNYLND